MGHAAENSSCGDKHLRADLRGARIVRGRVMECEKCEYARTEESAVSGIYFIRCFADIPGWGNGRVVERYKGRPSDISGRPAWCSGGARQPLRPAMQATSPYTGEAV